MLFSCPVLGRMFKNVSNDPVLYSSLKLMSQFSLRVTKRRLQLREKSKTENEQNERRKSENLKGGHLPTQQKEGWGEGEGGGGGGLHTFLVKGLKLNERKQN